MLVERVLCSVSLGCAAKREPINYLRITGDGQFQVAVATNGHLLLMLTIPSTEKGVEYIEGKAALKVTDLGGSVAVSSNCLSYGNCQVRYQPLEQVYPNIDAVISRTLPTNQWELDTNYLALVGKWYKKVQKMSGLGALHPQYLGGGGNSPVYFYAKQNDTIAEAWVMPRKM